MPARIPGVSPIRRSGGAQSLIITFWRRWNRTRYSTAIVPSGELSAPATSTRPAAAHAATRGRRRRRPRPRARGTPARAAPTTARASDEPCRRARCPRAAREPEQHDDRHPERRRLLDHHHQPRELLVGERREPEEALRLVDVDVVVGLEAEQERVREHLADPEQHDCKPESLVQRQATVPG